TTGKRWKHNDSSACRKRPPNGRTASLEHENNDHMKQKQTPNGVSPTDKRNANCITNSITAQKSSEKAVKAVSVINIDGMNRGMPNT
ncbi:hypothetical protein ACEWFW_10115, partial [Bifidobacterium catenulatum subsp. kashiwanohense]|uniref:hypothetical protein n=1 Tax=Bifidobacterium catenulatum TaxID=1686 RepID=UPI003CFE3518